MWHGDERLVLRPETVGFQVDAYAMLNEAQAQDLPGHLVRYLIEHSLERDAAGRSTFPSHYRYDDAALDAWLDEVDAGARPAAGRARARAGDTDAHARASRG